MTRGEAPQQIAALWIRLGGSPRGTPALPGRRMAAGLVLTVAAAWLGAAQSPPAGVTTTLAVDPAAAPAAFVDEAQCSECHESQGRAWTGSHHDLAMQPADAGSVLGDFGDREFTHQGVTSRFFRRDGRYFIRTDGRDGRLADFEVKHVFGFTPLQQYLVELPGGRLQALSLAWDTRPAAAGGQRWFHLYPNERIGPDDELHWTRPAQNWNFMCAECHATGLQRDFRSADRGYATHAARFDVGCQACHGPGSLHVAWARDGAAQDRAGPSKGFPVTLAAAAGHQVEACARCHARRAPLGDGFAHERRLMDDYLPALLDAGLYHADGQILDEVYEYGSFLQSPMHTAGVVCSDCHDPHGLAQRAPGNGQCVQCHRAGPPAAPPHVKTAGLKAKDYDSPSHHFHSPGGPGSACVDCHAPARDYMVVDPRRDHGFRIPRPDLSVRIGTPNACTGCHQKEGAQWAADVVERWYGPGRRQGRHWGEALHAGRVGLAGAMQGLVLAAGDAKVPAIARATALSLLARYPGAPALEALRAALEDPDPQVRCAAAAGQAMLTPAGRVRALGPRLSDPVRAVRIESVRLLAAVPAEELGLHADAFARALGEYEEVQRGLAGQAAAAVNLGGLYADLGRRRDAEAELRTAIQLDALFVPSYVNLADLQRAAPGGEPVAEATLRSGLAAVPRSAALSHALGLSLVRQRRSAEGLEALARAAELAPDTARFGYVHAVALLGAGRHGVAEAELERVLRGHPEDRDTRLALAGLRLETGDGKGAERLLRELLAINPGDPALAGALGPR